jgi:hypothetical protein
VKRPSKASPPRLTVPTEHVTHGEHVVEEEQSVGSGLADIQGEVELTSRGDIKAPDQQGNQLGNANYTYCSKYTVGRVL